jgi:GNAT superfamily N-acetyltransferase
MADDVRVNLRLLPDRIDSPVGTALVTQLNDDLRDRYGAEDTDQPWPKDLAPPGGIFLVAWWGKDPVGCGGVRLHEPGIGEIKRMYVDPRARRQGVARAVLTAVEEHALELGYTRLILETGIMQPEAIALYESHGYEAIPPYGHYKDSPLSRCYAKQLDDVE